MKKHANFGYEIAEVHQMSHEHKWLRIEKTKILAAIFLWAMLELIYLPQISLPPDPSKSIYHHVNGGSASYAIPTGML